MSRIPPSKPKISPRPSKASTTSLCKIGGNEEEMGPLRKSILFHFRMVEIKTWVCIKNRYAHSEKWMDLVEEACFDFDENKILVC